jgi:hypothetical protein
MQNPSSATLRDNEEMIHAAREQLSRVHVRVASGGKSATALPPPKLKYMVLQIIDDGGNIDWDWPRFSDQ